MLLFVFWQTKKARRTEGRPCRIWCIFCQGQWMDPVLQQAVNDA